MCTAVTYREKDVYFGRTLDYDFSYGEEVVITPRNYVLSFREMHKKWTSHYAMIGMAYVPDEYPLYYDAVNEKGLAMAGLNFVGNACYEKAKSGQKNVAQFELIAWILGQCQTVAEARERLAETHVTDTKYKEKLPAAALHWIIADRVESVVLELTCTGMHIYDNPVEVLTNNPPFPMQLHNLNNYMHLSEREPENHFSNQLPLHAYSRGMGALGMPGDWSSQSRFVRATFVKAHARAEDSEEACVNQFFHILESVEQSRGCCEVSDGTYEVTIYSACCNICRGIYYYTTYENHQVSAIDMHMENLDADQLLRYPLRRTEQICICNG